MADRMNAETVQRVYEAMGRDDLPAILGLVTDDTEWVFQGPASLSFAGRRHGRDGVEEFFTRVGESLIFEVFEPRRFVSDGDTVVVLGHERSRGRTTGASLEQEWAHVFTFRDGKIARFQGFEDTAGLVTTLKAG